MPRLTIRTQRSRYVLLGTAFWLANAAFYFWMFDYQWTVLAIWGALPALFAMIFWGLHFAIRWASAGEP